MLAPTSAPSTWRAAAENGIRLVSTNSHTAAMHHRGCSCICGCSYSDSRPWKLTRRFIHTSRPKPILLLSYSADLYTQYLRELAVLYSARGVTIRRAQRLQRAAITKSSGGNMTSCGLQSHSAAGCSLWLQMGRRLASCLCRLAKPAWRPQRWCLDPSLPCSAHGARVATTG